MAVLLVANSLHFRRRANVFRHILNETWFAWVYAD